MRRSRRTPRRPGRCRRDRPSRHPRTRRPSPHPHPDRRPRHGVRGCLYGSASPAYWAVSRALASSSSRLRAMARMSSISWASPGTSSKMNCNWRGQAQAGLGADQRAQAALGLVQRLLGAFAFALFLAGVAELGPVDLGQLQIVGHTDLGDRHVRQNACHAAGPSIEEAMTRWISAAMRAARGLVPEGMVFLVFLVRQSGPAGVVPWPVVCFDVPSSHIPRSLAPPTAARTTGETRRAPAAGNRPAGARHVYGGANGYLRSTSCISKVSMMSPISMSLKEPRLIPAS